MSLIHCVLYIVWLQREAWPVHPLPNGQKPLNFNASKPTMKSHCLQFQKNLHSTHAHIYMYIDMYKYTFRTFQKIYNLHNNIIIIQKIICFEYKHYFITYNYCNNSCTFPSFRIIRVRMFVHLKML